MKASPILEEMWRVKDELAREADYDVRQLCANVRKWAAGHRHGGPVVSNPAELRKALAEQWNKAGTDA